MDWMADGRKSGRPSDPQIEAADVFIDIDRLLAQFTERQREVLRLAVEGYRQREIAAMLNIERSVVSRHLSVARKKLRAYAQNEAETYCRC